VTDQGWDLNPFYPFHRPFFSEASKYSVELKVPQEMVVAHSGKQMSEELIEQGKKLLKIETLTPIREFSLAMSADYKVISEEANGIIIKSFYLPGDEERAKEALKDARDLMSFYSKRFGPYPYEEFSIAPVHLGYGGEQMSNMIFIDTRVYKLPKLLSRYFDFLIAHETGHQWFYNIIGVDEYSQMWLEEGIDSYFTEEYLDQKYGMDAEIVQWPPEAQPYISWFLPKLTFERTRDYRYKNLVRMGMDHSVVGELSSFHEPTNIFSFVYGKGARILRMLKSTVGDEAFDRIFRRMYQDFSFHNLDLEDFIRICEDESGQELSSFFDQWLRSADAFDYAVKSVKGDEIVLENRGGIAVPVDVKVTLKNGEEKTLSWNGATGASRTERIDVENPSPIQRVEIDPQNELLDIDETNNHWPRKIGIKPVPLYLGLYEIPLFLPEDQYNVVVGPEINSGLGVKASFQKPYDYLFYAGTDYEFGESIHHSRMGYELKNVFQSPTTAGIEISNRHDLDGGEEDLASGKVFLRRELNPVPYGFAEINDHVSLYMIRNQSLRKGGSILSRENLKNLDYDGRREMIAGTALHLNQAGPYTDPNTGYQLDAFFENAGHYLGGTQYFYRSGVDLAKYQRVTARSKLAMRVNYGWGYPQDKELYHLGGIDGLRGFDRKTVRGSNGLLGSLEYRFPLRDRINWYFLDNFFELEKIDGVVFFDGGQAWFDDFNDGRFRKDAGGGLRATVNIGAFLEKVVLRLDVAQSINEDDDPHVWFGAGHAF
ncbi:MAG: BamA/TamA family outer membrane protein, partial [Candidatus Omnitrophica bacterium]|nr:BamA/TamA family outer membrane protein [Candidatus Omnitrophota bacterium]